MRETPQALAAFVIYRDMGPNRRIEDAAVACKQHVSSLNRWSQAHRWVARASEHDQAIAQKAAAADIKARADDKERRRQNRLKVAEAERSLAAKGMSLMKPEELARKPYAIVQMLTHADATERLDTGEPTERLQGTMDHNVTFSITFDRADEDHNV